MSEEKFILIPVTSCSFSSGKNTINLIKGENYLLDINDGYPTIELDDNTSVKISKKVLKMIHPGNEDKDESSSKDSDFLKYYYINDFERVYPAALVCSTSLDEAVKLHGNQFGSNIDEIDCYEVNYDEVLNELTEDKNSTLDEALNLMGHPGILKTGGPFNALFK